MTHDHAGHDHAGHGHGGHGHGHAHGATDKTRVLIAACLTGGFMVAEALGGFLTGSLALLADAGHMLTDSIALGACLVRLPSRRARRRRRGSPTASTGSRRWSPTPTASPSSPSRCGSSTRPCSASSSRRRCSAGRCWWSRSLGLLVNIAGFFVLHGGDREQPQHARRHPACARRHARLGWRRSSRRWSSWRPAGRRSTRSCRCWSSLLILSTRLVADARSRACAARRRAAEPRPRRHRQRHRRPMSRACARSTTCMSGRSTARRTWRRCMPA